MSLLQAVSGVNPKHLIYGCGVALVLFVCWFFYQTGYSAAEKKYLEAKLDVVEESIEDHNEDVAEIAEHKEEIEKEKEIVEKVVYETVVKEVLVSECDSKSLDELAVLLNSIP